MEFVSYELILYQLGTPHHAPVFIISNIFAQASHARLWHAVHSNHHAISHVCTDAVYEGWLLGQPLHNTWKDALHKAIYSNYMMRFLCQLTLSMSKKVWPSVYSIVVTALKCFSPAQRGKFRMLFIVINDGLWLASHDHELLTFLLVLS